LSAIACAVSRIPSDLFETRVTIPTMKWGVLARGGMRIEKFEALLRARRASRLR
jgi:hypothetical protein